MKMELQKLLIFSYCSICLLLCINGIINGVEASHKIYPEFQSLEATNVKQVHRTGFHFQPPKHWINDPNGPMYYKGFYHLFYQYNPKGAVWGNIVWAHSVSKDMINWEALEPAIYPSKPFDIQGTWSGSATMLPGEKPVILYTGLDPSKRQVQNVAFPANLSDPYLRVWVKPDYNPIVVPSPDINASFFRDPTTAWWANGHWHFLVTGKRKDKGMAYLYRSKDFRKWIKAEHPLHSAPNTKNWECPDFYPVSTNGQTGLDTSVMGRNVKHVLKISLDVTRYDYYTIGRYDPVKDIYVPDNTSADGWNGLRYDYGNFYASKTFFDSRKNRRILLGWSNESDTTAEDIAKGWAGIQIIPRSLWLDRNGRQLMQWPIQELESLRNNKVLLTKQALKTGKYVEIKGITAAQVDVEVTFSLPSLDKAEPFDPSWTNAQDLCGQKGSTVKGGLGPFGLLTLASKNLEERTPVFFRVFKAQNKKHVVLFCSDARSSSLNQGPWKPSFAGFVDVDLSDKKLSLRSLVCHLIDVDLSDKRLSLRSLIDHSIVESFAAGGKTVITSRVYPTLAIMGDAHLYAFNNGSETITIQQLTAWSMKTPMMNN